MKRCGIRRKGGRRCRRLAHILTYRKHEGGLVEVCWYHASKSKRDHRGNPLTKAPNR